MWNTKEVFRINTRHSAHNQFYHYWTIDALLGDERVLQLCCDIPQQKQFLNIGSRPDLTLEAWIRKQYNNPGGR